MLLRFFEMGLRSSGVCTTDCAGWYYLLEGGSSAIRGFHCVRGVVGMPGGVHELGELRFEISRLHEMLKPGYVP